MPFLETKKTQHNNKGSEKSVRGMQTPAFSLSLSFFFLKIIYLFMAVLGLLCEGFL